MILRVLWRGAITADNAEAGFARIHALTNTPPTDTPLAAAITTCLAKQLIHDPVRLQEGALHCHWTLELTATGLIAARTLIEK